MNTLFISDIHLEANKPHLTRLFLQFLADEAPQADALYILGDWFAAWVGDDDRTELTEQISAALLKVAQQRVPIYFMPGNRDFLLGEKFLQSAGCRLLKDPTIIDLYGIRTLLMHGDTLCVDDKNYQRFRKLARNSLLQKIFLLLPLSLRRLIARFLRKQSQQTQTYIAPEISNAKQTEVARVMKEHQVNLLIHGHTHRPSIHYFNLNGNLDGNNVCHIVLSDWDKTGNMLICQPDGLQRLVNFNK